MKPVLAPNSNATRKGAASLRTLVAGVGAMIALSACQKAADPSFSLLPDSASFQSTTSFSPRPVDILWVVDNSGSMWTSQNNLANNFGSFIADFQTKNYDFRMAVTATDGWQGKYLGNQATMTRWRSSSPSRGSSGFTVLDRNNPSLTNNFMTNILQGTSGTGDERAFESMEDALNYSPNADFRRSGAYLTVIILSDEEDNSRDNPNWNSGSLYPLTRYTSLLEGLAGAGNYSVNAITILDSTCRSSLGLTGLPETTRYQQLATMTGGRSMSLCNPFTDVLSAITDTILQGASRFVLDREPIPASIVVRVDGTLVPNNPTNGWTYEATTMEIRFHGSAIPSAGSNIQVSFDPVRPRT